MSEKTFKPGTKRAIIASYCRAGHAWDLVYRSLKLEVMAQVKPWIFSANVNGHREPKPISDQLVELKNEIRRVYALLGRETSGDVEEDGTPIPDDLPETTPDVEIPDEPEEDEIPDDEPKPEASAKNRVKEEQEWFFSEWQRIRSWISARASETGSPPIDDLNGMRPVQAAMHAIAKGIPARAMLHAMSLHWSPETRQQAGIDSVDTTNLFPRVPGTDSKGRPYHRDFGYVLKLVEANKSSGGILPIMLVGPAGVGKTTLCEQLAEHLGLDFAATPLTAGATPSWLLGRYVLKMGEDGGYNVSPLMEIYSKGGVHLFGEIDASDPNMLLVANNMLSQDHYDNPINGERYVKHPDFIGIADANTLGLGANSTFTGRERLDGATIDRFRMGRVIMQLDIELVRRMVETAPTH